MNPFGIMVTIVCHKCRRTAKCRRRHVKVFVCRCETLMTEDNITTIHVGSLKLEKPS